MEYLVGAVTGMIILATTTILINRGSNKIVKLKPLSQSFVVNTLLQVSALYDEDQEEYDDHEDETKVVFSGNKAYWMDGSKFFVAESDGDSVFTSTKREVDTMSMSHVELSRLMKIVEALRSNDENRS